MALKTLQFPVAKMVNPQIGLNALGSMPGSFVSAKGVQTGLSPQAPQAVAPTTVSKALSLQPPSVDTPSRLPNNPITTGLQPFQAPVQASIPTWESTFKPYDPTTDPLMGAAAQAGQQQLTAGLAALQDTFGEQRKELEGRMFQGDLAGSGIQEAIYAKQGRDEGRQTEQLASEISAQTMMNQVDIMREGTDRAITLAQNQIDTAFKSGQLSIDEYNAYTHNLQAESDRLRALEDQRRTAIMEGQAFAPEGGTAFQDYLMGTYPHLFNATTEDAAAAPAQPVQQTAGYTPSELGNRYRSRDGSTLIPAGHGGIRTPGGNTTINSFPDMQDPRTGYIFRYNYATGRYE